MVYKCCVVNCRTNYTIEETNTVFSFPKDEDLRKRWIKFVNRKDWQPTSSSYICKKHFEPKYYKKGETNNRYRLIKELKPVPTIFDPSSDIPSTSSNLTSPVSIPRKSPRKRIFQEEQYETFVASDSINGFGDLKENLSPSVYLFKQNDDHVIFYKLTENELSIPEVTECIRIDQELHVKLFFKGAPVPLPQWFRQGRDCRLIRKSMLENFPVYLQSHNEKFCTVFDELREYKLRQRPVYSASVIRFALLLRYTSIQSYKILQNDFPLPSLPLLKKICSGSIDAVKCAQMLKKEGKISEDVCLMFDEMYLQKSEEYFAGNLIGCDGEGDMYKGIVCFMIVGLKESVPYVIKSSPETKVSATWLKDELLDCLDTLRQCGFNTRIIVCDNHPSNVSTFKKLLESSNQDPASLFLLHETRKIYLCYDTVHLMKNVRNNLLNHKRFLFPSFNFNGFKDTINVTGGELKWKLLHDVFENDAKLDGNLRKAPKLTAKALHPGNWKQNVPLALAIFDETTTAAIQSYFPDQSSAVGVLKLFQKWWTISNSKSQFSTTNYLGNAATNGDQKPSFLRAMAAWIASWQQQRISNCEKFTLTSQTSSALERTLNCHASLIQDLLDEGYSYVLTSRFQSDPLERRYGQYRQMSGGRFLVGLRDTTSSEKILKIKSLLKEEIDIDDNVKIIDKSDDAIENLLKNIDAMNCSPENITLSEDSREVGAHVAGYIARNLKKRFGNCCNQFLIADLINNEYVPEFSYINILSRGGLVVPSIALTNYVCTSFALLDFFSDIISKSSLSSRVAAENLLNHVFQSYETFTCNVHESTGQVITNRKIVNIFFNNQRKLVTDSVVADGVKSFKKRQREK